MRSVQHGRLDPVPGDVVAVLRRLDRPAFTIADIRRAVPGVSDNTIRLVLAVLKAEGRIASEGTGRTATWRRHV